MKNLKELKEVEISLKVKAGGPLPTKEQQDKICKKIDELVEIINPNLITVCLGKLAGYAGILTITNKSLNSELEAIFVAIPKDSAIFTKEKDGKS